MKKQFIVSALRNLDDFYSKYKKIFFVIDKNLEYFFTNNKNSQYSIKYAYFTHTNRDQLLELQRYIDKKYYKYLKLLSFRLNNIHNTSYDLKFWSKILQIPFLRSILLIYEAFLKYSCNFDVNVFDFEVLKQDDYYIPQDFNDVDHFLTHSHFGQEELFSIYVNCFFKEQEFNEFSYSYNGIKQINNIDKIGFKKAFFRFLNPAFFIKIIKKMLLLRSPKVAIIYSYFSTECLNYLIFKSLGSIAPIDIKINNIFSFTDYNWEQRSYLADYEEDFDDFDKYFFSCLKYLMPQIYIEYFDKITNYYNNFFNNKRLKKLKYVVSEAWIGNNQLSIALAVLQTKGVKHINNEHNCLFQQVMGNYNKYIAENSDYYLTLGWSDIKHPQFIQGASLFEFNFKKHCSKEDYILYIGDSILVKRRDSFGCFASSGENAPKYIKFQLDFFSHLSLETRKNIIYRKYPNRNWLLINEEDYLNNYLKEFKLIDDATTSAKIMMKKAKLVIASYIATSYLEAMIMNIPTIFFLNQETYFLNNEYKAFFNGLIKAGICQINPILAARFVEEIKNNPDKWWGKPEVQTAKNKFLDENIGDPKIMINYLLGLTK